MFSVHFYNFGYTKHFDTIEEARECGKQSGFQYVIYLNNEIVK